MRGRDGRGEEKGEMGRGDDEVNCLNYRDLGDAIEGMLNSNKRLFSSLLHELEKGRDLKFKVLPPTLSFLLFISSFLTFFNIRKYS